MVDTTDIEKKSLEAHVELCADRQCQSRNILCKNSGTRNAWHDARHSQQT